MMYIEILKRMLYDAIGKFDFEKTAALYKVLNWKWCGEFGTPSAEELKVQAQALGERAILEFMKSNKAIKCSTGGLQVTIFEWEHSYELSLTFACEDSTQIMSKLDILSL